MALLAMLDFDHHNHDNAMDIIRPTGYMYFLNIHFASKNWTIMIQQKQALRAQIYPKN